MSPVFDSYIRLTEPALQGLALMHLQSGIDAEDEPNGLRAFEAMSLHSISGYTEWLADAARPVSVGWDWAMSLSGEPMLSAHSVRTNVMLIDEHGRDLGHRATSEAVTRLLNGLAWAPVVLAAVQCPLPSSPP